MTDLVKQARELGGFSPEAELCSLMADEIERLRWALEFIIGVDRINDAHVAARAALGEKE